MNVYNPFAVDFEVVMIVQVQIFLYDLAIEFVLLIFYFFLSECLSFCS